MNKSFSKVFDNKINNWIEGQNKPWGKLRYEIAFVNLKKHLPKKKLTILDIGGGNGYDSIPLAKIGHKITIVDYSQNMLNKAKLVLKKNHLTNVELINCDLNNIKDKLTKKFDVILCHNVLSYVDDEKKSLKIILSLLKRNGILSIMQINRYSEVIYPLVFEKNIDKTISNIDIIHTKANTFNVPIKRFSPEELINLTEKFKTKLIKRYGILIACSLISDNKIKYQKKFYNKLKKLELLLTEKYPFYLMSRFIHLIFKKNK